MAGKRINASISEAQTTLSDLVKQAEAGDKVMISRRGKPVAELVPVTRPAERKSSQEELLIRKQLLLTRRNFAERVRAYLELQKAREQAVKSVRQSENRLRRVLECASEGVLEVDGEGRILLLNRAARKMFGYAAKELLRLNVDDLVPEAARHSHARHRAQYAKDPHARPMGIGMELMARRKDGTLFPVEIGLSPSHAGSELKVIVLVHDVSARKRAQDALRRSEEKLRQAEKLEALARMAGGTAHEFNNLLTMVMGYAALMLSSLDSRRALIDYIEKISRASRRAADLTRQLLAFSHRQMLAPQIIDLNEVLADMREILPSLLGHDINTTLVPAPEAACIRADRSQIHQVMVNLVANAREAMPEGGKLSIGVSTTELQDKDLHEYPGMAPGNYVVLEVSDTGTGMSREIQSRLFEPFFSTKELGKGTGLSLAAIYGIVQQSGGNISVKSQPGAGTTFRILLPRIAQAVASSGLVYASVPTALRGAETILLVEDEPSLRELTLEFLLGLGYQVLDAAEGDEAIRIATEFPGAIDLLLTDVVMPGKTGRDIARELVPLRSGMKVLYVSGYTDEEFSREGLTGHEFFLEKPFAFEELAEKIRSILGSADPAADHFPEQQEPSQGSTIQ